MTKLLVFSLAAVFCFGTVAIASPSASAAGSSAQVVRKSKTVYRHGRRVTITTWHRGKHYTKKGWRTGHRWGRKVVVKTKHVIVGKPRHRRP